MIEWYSEVNALLSSQNLTRQDVIEAVANCQDFRLRPGLIEAFGLAYKTGIPIIVVSAGLGNIIEEVVRQNIPMPNGFTGKPGPNVRVLSNCMEWGKCGNHIGFSDPLIRLAGET